MLLPPATERTGREGQGRCKRAHTGHKGTLCTEEERRESHPPAQQQPPALASPLPLPVGAGSAHPPGVQVRGVTLEESALLAGASLRAR